MCGALVALNQSSNSNSITPFADWHGALSRWSRRSREPSSSDVQAGTMVSMVSMRFSSSAMVVRRLLRRANHALANIG